MDKIAFLFPGQGSHYVGMGKTLYEQFPIAKETFEEANKVIGFDLQKICFNGPHDELTKTKNTQPAILTATVAAFKVFRQEVGIEPDFLVGHSFGELSALVCSEAIQFCDAIKIARLKGQFAQEDVLKMKSAMTAVSNIEEKEIKKICENVSSDSGKVVIGIINSLKQIVITGDEESVKRAEKLLSEQGADLEQLAVSAPFHSSLLENAAKKTKEELSKLKYKKPKWPVLSSATIKLYKSSDDIINNLSLDLIRPTYWLDAIKYLVKHKVIIGIEIGPKTVLKKIMSEITDKIETHSFSSPKDLEPLKKGLEMDKKSKYEVIIACMRIVVTTKNNNDNNDEYDKGVAQPYKKIKEMLLDLEKKDTEPTMVNVIEALRMIKFALKTKKVKLNEQKERLNEEIFEDNKMLLHVPEVREMFSYIR